VKICRARVNIYLTDHMMSFNLVADFICFLGGHGIKFDGHVEAGALSVEVC
jgi:hypothetical protein